MKLEYKCREPGQSSGCWTITKEGHATHIEGPAYARALRQERTSAYLRPVCRVLGHGWSVMCVREKIIWEMKGESGKVSTGEMWESLSVMFGSLYLENS